MLPLGMAQMHEDLCKRRITRDRNDLTLRRTLRLGRSLGLAGNLLCSLGHGLAHLGNGLATFGLTRIFDDLVSDSAEQASDLQDSICDSDGGIFLIVHVVFLY